MQNKLTNSLLAIIAACLVFQVAQSLTKKQIAVSSDKTMDVNIVGVSKDLPVMVQNQKPDVAIKSPVEVMIVGTTKDLPVAVQNQTPIDFPKEPFNVNIVGAVNNLPVEVKNTVDVDVDGHIGESGYGRKGLPVIIVNNQ